MRSLLKLGAHPANILKHQGPGTHPGTGTPQTVHAPGKGKGKKPFQPTGPEQLMMRINDIQERSTPFMSEDGVRRGEDTMGLYGEWEGDNFLGWTPERYEWHQDVIAAHEQLQIEENGRPPKAEKRALVMTGLPGAGKTFVLKHFAPVDLADYVVVNADDLKESIIFDDSPPSIGEEYKGMELSSVVHEESSAMAKAWQANLVARDMNMALDITGGNRSSTLKRIGQLQEVGYQVDIVHVDVGPKEAWQSTIKRYEDGLKTELGGRPVPPKFIEALAVNEDTDVIDHHFDMYRVMANGSWWHYRNYPITKQTPELMAASD